jgi:hypothetical protein
MRSGVFVRPDGGLLVGSAARAAAVDHPDRYVDDPSTIVAAGHLDIAQRTITPAQVYAAILTAVRSEANRIAGRPVTAVALTVPSAWGRIRRDVMSEASATAGFTDTVIVTAATAVAAYVTATTGTAVPQPGYVLVCDAGAAAMTLTVLEQHPDGLQQLSAAAVAAAAGRDIDRIVAAYLLEAVTPPGATLPMTDTDATQWRAVLATAEDAKVALVDRDRVAVALHDPHPPVVLDRRELAKITGPAYAALGTAVDDVLAAADINPGHLNLVVLTGAGATLPGVEELLANSAGRPPVVPDRTDIAAADGALTATDGSGDTRDTAPASIPRVRLRATDLVRPALLGGASLALLAAVVITMWTTSGPSRYPAVHLAEELISAAAVVAVLTAWSVAHLLPTLYLTGQTPNPDEAVALIRATFAGAGTLGIAVATLYGLAIGALVSPINTEYASTAIVPALPVALGALVIAALAKSVPLAAIPAWLGQLRHPLAGVLLGSVGILAMRYAVSAQIGPGLMAIIIRLGAMATGIAIALTVVRSRRLKILTAAVLAIGGATVASLANNRIITLAYIAAASSWLCRPLPAPRPPLPSSAPSSATASPPGRQSKSSSLCRGPP